MARAPEQPEHLDQVIETVRQSALKGKASSIIVVAAFSFMFPPSIANALTFFALLVIVSIWLFCVLP